MYKIIDSLCFFSGAEVSDCGKFLVLAISQGCDPVNRLFYVDLSTLPDDFSGLLTYVKVVDNFDAEYEVETSSKVYYCVHLLYMCYKFMECIYMYHVQCTCM